MARKLGHAGTQFLFNIGWRYSLLLPRVADPTTVAVVRADASAPSTGPNMVCFARRSCDKQGKYQWQIKQMKHQQESSGLKP